VQGCSQFFACVVLFEWAADGLGIKQQQVCSAVVGRISGHTRQLAVAIVWLCPALSAFLSLEPRGGYAPLAISLFAVHLHTDLHIDQGNNAGTV
jgi:hypothetical protein